MLLIVALFAVFFAWLGAQRELQRMKIQGELEDLQYYREHAKISRPYYTSEQAWEDAMAGFDAQIANKQKQLGH